ncbi:hypothetical protein Ga0100231_012830 [Opitutaceae bacterium TAV4]|nr:hypothetical protein Ga0100231_012830 [Opitutaceae bacterium TAV4]RRJ99317.1 hypothetical protein Ga0100230_014120 [Opitutaceae bacterium TAV3]
MKPDQPKPTVSVEDLLRLKRAERPSEEFWTRFEKELHTKQLAACIEPRPWWLGISLVWRKASPAALPIGALAALALSVVGVVNVQRMAFSASPSSDPAATTSTIAAQSTPITAPDGVAPATTLSSTATVATLANPTATMPTGNGGASSEDGNQQNLLAVVTTATLAAQTPAVSEDANPAHSSTAAVATPSARAPAVTAAVASLTGTSTIVSLPPLAASGVAGLVISSGGHSSASDSDWLGVHMQHESDLPVALLPLAGHHAQQPPLTLLTSLLDEDTTLATASAPDNALSAIRSNPRLARLISFLQEAESYAMTDESGSTENQQRNSFRRVDSDDVLPSAVRRLVGGGDRVSFRF